MPDDAARDLEFDLIVSEDAIRGLESSDPETRRVAAWRLGYLGRAEEDGSPLMVPLTSSAWELRSPVRSLEELEGARTLTVARAVEALIVALRDPDGGVRRDVVTALRVIGDARAIEPLIAALGDSCSSVRCAAVFALMKLGDARAVGLVSVALSNADRSVRRAAAEALGELHDAREIELLVGALSDPDRDVRCAAVRALRRLRDPRAIEPLIGALSDPERRVRMHAVFALERTIENPDAMGAQAMDRVRSEIQSARDRLWPPDR